MTGYKITGYSSRATEFIMTNSDDRDPVESMADVKQIEPLLPLHVSGVLIHIIEMDGRLRVMIDVDDDATHENLRSATTIALLWRERLLEWQGPRRISDQILYLERFHNRHGSGGKLCNFSRLDQ